MNTNRSILLLTVVSPGLVVLIISLYYFGTDYAALIKAENYAKQLVQDATTSERQVEDAYHRALAHRINVFADGTWGLLGCLITAVGIHGMLTVKEKDD